MGSSEQGAALRLNPNSTHFLTYKTVICKTLQAVSAKMCYFLKHFQILLQASSELEEALTLDLILRLQGSAGTVPMVHWQTPNVPIKASFNAS